MNLHAATLLRDPYDITSYTYPITATCSGVPNCNDALARQMALLLTSTARMSSYSTWSRAWHHLTAQAMTWSLRMANAGGIQMDFTFMISR